MLPLAFCCVALVSGKIYAKGFPWCQVALAWSRESRRALKALIDGGRTAASPHDVYVDFSSHWIELLETGFF